MRRFLFSVGVALALLFAFGTGAEQGEAEARLAKALALYEEARIDGLMWRSRYEERAAVVKRIEGRQRKLDALINAGRALPLPIATKEKL